MYLSLFKRVDGALPLAYYDIKDLNSLVDDRTSQISSMELYIEIGSEIGLYPQIQYFLLDSLMAFKSRDV